MELVKPVMLYPGELKKYRTVLHLQRKTLKLTRNFNNHYPQQGPSLKMYGKLADMQVTLFDAGNGTYF